MPRPSPDFDAPGHAPVVLVPEIRDYHRINAQVVQHLDRGHHRIRLVGVEGQRLLLWGLRGAWHAVIEVEGHAGPELAATLDAPGLVVVCRGSAADGAGRGLRAGSLVVLDDASEAVGYAMFGGTVVVVGASGHRAGLDQAGGVLVLGGGAGRLAGERQADGLLLALGPLGPYASHGRRGGRLLAGPAIAAAREEWRGAILPLASTLPTSLLAHLGLIPAPA